MGVPPRDLEADLGPGPALGSSPIPNTPAWVAAGIPADLLRRRPDVRSAERQVAAQSAQIGVAEADFYPTIFINGTLGWDAENFSQAFSTKSFLGLLTPGFRWNILNYGRILNNVRLQEARLQELIASYQTQVLSAGREVQVPLRGFLKSREQADDLARSVTAAAAATEVGVAQYRTGTIDFNRVFNLETTQVQQQDRLATAQGDIALNLIAVYRALGGGWELRLQKDPSHADSTAHAAVVATAPRAMRRLPQCRERRSQEEASHDENANRALGTIVLAVMTHAQARGGEPGDREAQRPHFLRAASARRRLQPGRPRHVPLVEPALFSPIVRARRLLP